MTDQYKAQYKKETEQIHAPADLIARTKAAVREEEARLQREFAAQTTKSGMQAAPAVQRTINRGAAARKWAYPLTAVAAVMVLVSVSMMMRGMAKSSEDGAASFEAADCGGAEAAAATDSEGEEFAAAGAVEEGIEEEAFESAEAAEEPEMEAASVTEAQDMASEMEMASEKKMDSATAGTANMDSAAEAPAGSVEEYADETERAAVSDKTVSEDRPVAEVTVKRVWTRPAFADRADAELQTYEDKEFWVVKEDRGWAAYVESGSKGGYEIRGEAEDLESFLEAGYQRLEEISY